MTFKEESWCACGAHTVIEARDSLEAYAARSVWHGAHKDHHASTSPAEPLPAPKGQTGLCASCGGAGEVFFEDDEDGVMMVECADCHGFGVLGRWRTEEAGRE